MEGREGEGERFRVIRSIYIRITFMRFFESLQKSNIYPFNITIITAAAP
jgi:hypothetical protein